MCAPFVTIAHSTSTLSTPTPTTVSIPTSAPTNASLPTSTSGPPSIYMQSSYPLGIPDELLCELCNMKVNG